MGDQKRVKLCPRDYLMTPNKGQSKLQEASFMDSPQVDIGLHCTFIPYSWSQGLLSHVLLTISSFLLISLS